MPLPISYIVKVKAEGKENIIQVICDDIVLEILNLSYAEEYYVVFTVDENQLYCITVIYSLLGRYVPPNINKDLISDQIIQKTFTIPRKQTINNTEINGLGIDLGTSRCCAAVNRKNGIETVALDYKGQRLLPSYVGFEEDKTKCGQLVVKRLRHFAKYTVFDAKRFIGVNYEDIVMNNIWPFSLINASGAIIEVETSKQTSRKTPEEIASILLKHVKQKAEEFQGQKLSKVVVTVPATFTKTQEDSTRSAAIIAGFDVVELLPESIAAAFAYFIDRPIPNGSRVLLFDLGGGTLDVCIFKIANDEIEILSNDGNSQLGGRDFDNLLVDYYSKKLEEYGITDLGDKKYNLILDCQKIKEDLSELNEAWLDIDQYDPSKSGFIKITQKEFENLAKDLITKIQNMLLSVLNKIQCNKNDIEKVLFVGGGSRMPMIKRIFKEMFINAELICEQHPDEVVAIGAAYYAYKIFSDATYMKLVNNKKQPLCDKISDTENPCCFISTNMMKNNISKDAVGIDMGISTCILVVNRKNGVQTVALDINGERFLPAYVAYDETQEKYGRLVIDRMYRCSNSTVFDAQKIIGKKLTDIEIDSLWPFGVMEVNGKVYIKTQGSDKREKLVSAEEVTAILLKYMKHKAEEFQGKKLSKTVITIPIDFTEAQKDATMQVSIFSGWEDIHLLPDPIAGFIVYFVDRSIPRNSIILLFDINDITLNVYIIKIEENQVKIIAHETDSNLGIKNFCNILFNYFHNLLKVKYGITVNENRKYKLKKECQRMVRDLSHFQDAWIYIDEFDASKDGDVAITPQQFQNLSKSLLNKIMTAINSALYKSGYKAEQIEKVFHMGEDSRMPVIQELLQNCFKNAKPCCEEYPDEVNAIGATYYAFCSNNCQQK